MLSSIREVSLTSKLDTPVETSSDVHPPGHPLAGEPILRHTRVPLGPVRKSRESDMPLMQAAADRAMGRVSKFLSSPLPETPGEVPPGGTPTGKPTRPDTSGSVLPLVAASRSLARTDEEWAGLISLGQIIPPPYDPWWLVCVVEESSILPPLIDAMATNLTGFGWTLDPLFPTRNPEDGQPLDPPPEAKTEREVLELFLASCNIKIGLLGVLERSDRDLEATGNGYTEVLRDGTGRVAAFEHLPSYTVRLSHQSSPVRVELPFRHPVTGQLVILPRYQRFRTFVQVRDGRMAYFKEFGDPRQINWRTGEFREPGESWGLDQYGNSLDGTEVIHTLNYATHSPYGVPRWVGASADIKSSRAAEELIANYFENAPIGVKIFLVAGGVWRKESMAAAVATLSAETRGVDNAFAFATLEADGQTADLGEETRDTAPRIATEDLVAPLDEMIYKEGGLLDQQARRIARMFRMPPIYWGASDDFSLAAANTARAAAEEQVFVPLRRSRWEHFFNVMLLPSMGVNYWKWALRGANTTDDSEISKGLQAFVAGGGASPNQLIRLMNDLTAQDQPIIPEEWGNRPLELTLALIAAGQDPNAPLADLDFTPEPVPGSNGDPAQDAEEEPPAPKKGPKAAAQKSENKHTPADPRSMIRTIQQLQDRLTAVLGPSQGGEGEGSP